MNAVKSSLMMLTMCVALLGNAAMAQSPGPLAKAPTWQPPAVEEVKAQAFAWLQEQQADEAMQARADQLWSNLPEQPTGAEFLDCLAETFALVDTNVSELVQLCSHRKSQLLLPSLPWLTDPKTSPLVAQNMRLLYGRWLVHEMLFDESLDQLAELKPEDVVAPALLLFYQGVAHHTLLNKEAGLNAIDRLLEGAQQSPRRYVAVARLMQQDLMGLEDDTLGHIARRMDDIRRRLDLGRAGEKVRGIEDGVIESLDKMIKKLEEEQKKRQGGGSSNNIRSSNPAQDSRIMGGKGPGDVTKRRIGSDSGWGDLPPKQREEALQQIGREFPSHYRDIIEQYFRRLAAEGSEER